LASMGHSSRIVLVDTRRHLFSLSLTNCCTWQRDAMQEDRDKFSYFVVSSFWWVAGERPRDRMTGVVASVSLLVHPFSRELCHDARPPCPVEVDPTPHCFSSVALSLADIPGRTRIEPGRSPEEPPGDATAFSVCFTRGTGTLAGRPEQADARTGQPDQD